MYTLYRVILYLAPVWRGEIDEDGRQVHVAQEQVEREEEASQGYLKPEQQLFGNVLNWSKNKLWVQL